MSGKSNARYSQSRTDSRIGSGARVDGNISFTGVLQIQGAILGDVSCEADLGGTIVVGQSGNVAGTMRAPHIVVSGKVSGPSYSSETIEIQPGACLAGDTFYKQIEVQAGGIIEGSLTPSFPIDNDSPRLEPQVPVSEPQAVMERDLTIAHAASVGHAAWGRPWGWRTLAGVMMVLVAVLTVVLSYRDQPPDAPPAADVVLKTDPSMKMTPPAPTSPVAGGAPQDGPRDDSALAANASTGPDVDKKGSVQTPAPDLPEIDPERVVVVQGVNPGKPAGVLSVVSEGPSVLFRRKRQDPFNRTRIEIPNGASTIAIAKDELLRVAEGHNIVIFYQGRKVGPKTIEGGAWMSFAPQSPGGATE